MLSLLVAGWIGGGAWALRYAAGGMFYIAHKTDPRQVQAETWQEYWAEYKEDKKERKRLQASMGFAAFAIFGVPLFLILLAMSKSRSLHGEARWATSNEINRAGLNAEDGLILGKFNGKFLMMNEPKFIMLVAPTRSGKGVGTIIPNLLNWNQSCIVVDIKGENFKVTSGFRARHGQEIYKFAPFEEDFQTHCWNPLSYVSRDPRFMVGELQSIGYMLYPKKDGDTAAFFNDTARNLFVALCLYCYESGYPMTIGEVMRRSTGDGHPKEYWQAVVDSGLSGSGKALSSACVEGLKRYASNSENTLAGISSTFSAPLDIFTSFGVDAATSSDDFDLRDIRRRKMTIYVVVPPTRLAEASLLINLFFSIAIDQNTKTLPENDPTLKYLALLLADELPALGRVDKYVKSIGYIAGYGLRSLMIAQSMSQLKDRELYGEEGARTLAGNHIVQIIYAPREQQDAQDYSEILGYYGLNSTSKGVSRGPTVTNSENVSQQKRALMLPQELREMGPDRIIVMTDNCKPIFGEKIEYYSDPAFTNRLLPPVKVPRLDVEAFSAKAERRIRALQPGEQVPASQLAIDLDSMPPVTNTETPLAHEVSAMADWLFTNVRWAKAPEESAPPIKAPAPSLPEPEFS
nr:type IV secretory system conjugative DNA transfer family protein [Acidovorax sp. SUPP3334]